MLRIVKGIADTDAAWLAGLFDGEGSIGITQDRRSGTLRVAVQMSMTCKMTIDRTIVVLDQLGVRGLGYSYREKNVEKHKDAHYLRVNRIVDVALLAERMLPYAVTKRRHWEAAALFCRSRLLGVEVDDLGRIVRGRTKQRPYTAEEQHYVEALRDLNQRGPRRAVA